MDWPNSVDREAELRRRNEEISRQAGEAMRVAQAVVRQQEAKLVMSPGSQARSPARQERAAGSSAGGTPDHRSSSARESLRSSQGKFLAGDDEDEEGEAEYDEEEYEERPSSTRMSPQRSPPRQTTSAGSARRELHMEEGRGAERGVTPQMGAEATIRYLKAKLKVVEEELDESVAEAKESRDALHVAEKRVHELEQTSAKAGSMQANARLKADKLKAELDKKVDSLERQLAATEREKENIERTKRQTENATGARDVRLNRALEEVDKYKRMLAESKTTHAEQLDASRKQLDKVMAEKKKLVRQKNELMNGFKKQMKLIDILRRQLIHVQAAKLLSLTEEEFTRALELGETI